METHKSLHICTDKCDWMLYPWLPSHVICIIFITKPYSVFLFFSSPSFLLTPYTASQSYMWTDENPSHLSTAWRANELHVRSCTSRWSYIHLFGLAALGDKSSPALVWVPLRQLCNLCWSHCKPIACMLAGKKKKTKSLNLSTNSFARKMYRVPFLLTCRLLQGYWLNILTSTPIKHQPLPLHPLSCGLIPPQGVCCRSSCVTWPFGHQLESQNHSLTHHCGTTLLITEPIKHKQLLK